MRRRQPIVRELVEAFPSQLALFNMAYYTIVARRTLTPEEEASQLAELTTRLQDISLPDEVIRMTIALHILETGGEGHAQALIAAASGRAPQMEAVAGAPRVAAAIETPDREVITSSLAERFSLDALKDIALEVVERKAAGDVSADWRKYVEGTAGDVDSPEPVRRTNLARFVVDKAGPVFAAEKLTAATSQESPPP
jgi:hypothetical protein